MWLPARAADDDTSAEVRRAASSTSAPTTSKPAAARRARGAAARAPRRARRRRSVVPRRVAHLRPLVGAHHHDVVARGDVGDQLRVGHDHTRATAAIAASRSSSRDARVERPLRRRVLAERDARDREVEPVERAGAHRGFGDRDVRDRRRIERPGVDAAPRACAHAQRRGGHDRERGHAVGAFVAHFDAQHRAVGARADHARGARTGPIAVRREEVQHHVGGDAAGRVLGREVDERRDRAAVQDAPRVAQRVGERHLDRRARRPRARRATRESAAHGSAGGSPGSSTSGRSHCGGPFSGTRIADVSTPSTTSASPAPSSRISHRGHDARAALAQHARVDAERADVVEAHGARRQVRRDDPAVGERGEPAAQPADVVEHREQRARAHAAVGTAQVLRRGRVPDEHRRAALGALDLVHRDAHVARHVAARRRSPKPVGRVRRVGHAASPQRRRRDDTGDARDPRLGAGVDQLDVRGRPRRAPTPSTSTRVRTGPTRASAR